MTVTTADIITRASLVAFGEPLITNVLRSMIVETIVDFALPSEWNWCSGNYAGWDFEHKDLTRLEVKQSSALQTWKTERESAAIFDIAPRTGYWLEGNVFVKKHARHAQLYVFARHPLNDCSVADHRDPYQWDFYVVPTFRLLDAEQRTIGLDSIVRLGTAKCSFEELGARVEEVRVIVAAKRLLAELQINTPPITSAPC